MSQKSIQLSIPSPCHEDWDKMTPCEQGRHCTHCSKTVIDFTAWSDTALYAFFTKKQEHVCGRFLSTQLNRPIHIPPQPHSRLYRMVIAMGLTLIFAQTKDAYGQVGAPLVKTEAVLGRVKSGVGYIRGMVLDEKKAPVWDVEVKVYQDGVLKGNAKSSLNGDYMIKPLEAGTYELLAQYGNRSLQVTGIDMPTTNGLIINVQFGNDTDLLAAIPFSELRVSTLGERNSSDTGVPFSKMGAIIYQPLEKEKEYRRRLRMNKR